MIARTRAATAFLLLGGAAQAQAPARTPFDAPERVDLDAPVVTVPLTKDGEFYFAAVRINGRPFRFTIETGANFIGISTGAARALALRIDSIPVAGPGAQQSQLTPIAHIDSLVLGGATYRGLTARVSSMWDNQGFDGIITLPFFQGLVAGLELSKSRLLLSGAPCQSPMGGTFFH